MLGLTKIEVNEMRDVVDALRLPIRFEVPRRPR